MSRANLKKKPVIQTTSRVLGALALTAISASAGSRIVSTLFDSSPNQSPNGNAASQRFTDYCNRAPVFSFDDVTIPQGASWVLDRFTAFGVEGSQGGDPSKNQSVNLAIFLTPDATATPFAVFTGIEDPTNDLVFDLGGYVLPAGTYWFSAYVERPFNLGGQWFWNRTQNGSPLFGTQAVLHDPCNVSGRGFTTPSPFEKVFGAAVDLSFRIEGTVRVQEPKTVPEPVSVLSLLAAGLWGGYSALQMRR